LQSLREDLFSELGYITDAFYRSKIEVALQLAFHAHHGQRRKSGEPFVHHPAAVAKILAGLRMDPDSIVAGLLHVR
jgi:(p)ppGpp synthase/HD superfamily hydrolase